MKRRRTGFTLVELLTVLAIISMLIGLILPSMAMVRRIAKETKQKAQLNSIGLALTAFRDDYGDYPPSTQWSDSTSVTDYSGGQKLAEALLGRDLLGFHPLSNWSATDAMPYDPITLDERKGHYLELGTENAFRLALLFAELGPAPLAGDTHVICDVFGVKDVVLPGEKVRAGQPILYYKANTSSKTIGFSEEAEWKFNIYDFADNMRLVFQAVKEMGVPHALESDPVFFYQEYIKDPKVLATPWPYRPDSYLLISAGADGLYGTTDDITNFGN